MKKLYIILPLLILTSMLIAQWSSNPLENLKVTDSSYNEVIPKIDYGPEGDVWVSWFSSENGNYNVRIQRFNFNGEAQFNQEGILVSNNTQMSWLTNWDMKVDSENNAILSFLDIRTGDLDIYVYKISPEGNFVWGENGVALSNDATEDYTPCLEITDQNNVIVAWMSDVNIKLHKISSTGTVINTEPIIFSEEGFSFTWPQIFPQENDSFILKYAKDSGPMYAVTRHIFAQKYDTDLNPIWDNPVTITDQGGISSWTQIFSTASDGAGGFVICWYEDRDGDQMRNVYVQHVLADGNIAFTQNGIQPTSNFSMQHFYPITTYNQVTNDTYMIWTPTDANQDMRGLFVQKFDSSGNKIFSENGQAIINLGSNTPLAISANISENNLIVVFSEDIGGNSLNSKIKAFKLNDNGEHLWDTQFVTLKETQSSIVHPASTNLKNNQIILAWEDSRNNPENLYLQNINSNGTLGIQNNPTGIFGTISLNAGQALLTDVIINIDTYNFSPNASGYYSQELPAGTYSLTATLENYEPYTTQDIVITEGQMTELNIILEVIPVFNPPLNLSGEIIDDNVILNWESPANIPNSMTLTGYKIYKNDQSITNLIETTNYTDTDITLGNTYHYYITAIYTNPEGESDSSNVITLNYTNITDTIEIPQKTKLHNNYPNPFNPSTAISFDLSSENLVNIEIYNSKGQKIKSLINKTYAPGKYTLIWAGKDDYNKQVTSGIYFYKIKSGSYTHTKKMILMK
jgi:hypothetical protein